MLGFKKVSKEEELEDEEELKPKRRRSKKDPELKDLNPKNKNKRKEPPKPWGKSERLLVLSLVIGTAAIAGILGLSSRNWKLPGLPRLDSPELDVNRTIALEADEATDTQAKSVKEQFTQDTRTLSGVYGFYVGRLFEDESYGSLQDDQFLAGELMYLPVVTAIYIEEEEGRILSPRHKELVERMLRENEQAAFDEAVSLVGSDRIQQIIDEIGMSKTSLKEGITTPADVGKLLRKLWERRLISEDNTEKVFDLLSSGNSVFSALSEGIRVVSISASELHTINTAGIIHGDRQPFVVVMMSKGVVEQEANDELGRLIQLIYEAETN